MKSDLIKLDINGPRWRVTINRPRKANALNREMLDKLLRIFAAAAEAPELRALVITGAGGKNFCAGADLAELSTDPKDARDAIWDEVSEALNAVPALTLAKINGPCIGGGLVLALACDIRVCVPGAVFAYPALRKGVLPGRVDGARLDALIGPGRASLLLLGDVRIGADEALAWGLVERIWEHTELDSAVDGLSLAARETGREHLARLKKRCRADYS